MKTPASSTYINERVEIAVSSDTCRTIVMEIFILSLLSLQGQPECDRAIIHNKNK